MQDAMRRRREMVERQIVGRGLRSPAVVAAMRAVPREEFVPPNLREFAFNDSPLPIEEGQTISQPYMVAFMVEALDLEGGERVLEIGTGSGYAAAVLAEIASEVVTVERHERLGRTAAERLARLGYDNVRVVHADGTRGWPEEAPYDAIVVAAGGPRVPESLREQLEIEGRLVIPVGVSPREQVLVRVRRIGTDRFEQEEIGAVRFVPLIGAEGWGEGRPPSGARPAGPRTLPERIAATAEPIEDIEDVDLGPLLERVGDARVVLLGEASHGTSEFYRMRARITRALVTRLGFDLVAVEADWPDAARVDHYVRHKEAAPAEWTAFTRFPTWMWRNQEFRAFVDWLHRHNAGEADPARRVGFHGLDLYSLYTSIHAVLEYLDDVDPEAAEVARERYGCLTPWQADPSVYGHAALSGRYRSCEEPVVSMLSELLSRRMEYASADGERFLDAVQNARLVADAERYYRTVYYGSTASWNLRDSHMFDCLQALLEHRGSGSRAVVWEHNSHVGDARATEFAARGQHNVGQLCREAYGPTAYVVGFGTDRGTVAAASHWHDPVEVKEVRPSHPRSYERQFHDSATPALLLPLRDPASPEVRSLLLPPRLERAIGVIYRPETELESHYFEATLPEQFDEYVWFDRTEAVRPLDTAEVEGMPETYPFGL